MDVPLAFDEPPLRSEIVLDPPEGSNHWRYAVDLDEDGRADRTGTLERRLGFAFRFDEPGVHRLRVELVGPDGPRTTEPVLVVDDPQRIRVPYTRKIASRRATFLGIAATADGRHVFVSNYDEGTIHRLDGRDLRVEARAELFPQPISLAVAPGDSLLYVASRKLRLHVVAIPSLELRRSFRTAGRHFVRILDDDTALVSGEEWFLQAVNPETGEIRQAYDPPWFWHFDRHPFDGRIVAANGGDLLVISWPDLMIDTRWHLNTLLFTTVLQFHPDGRILYKLGTDNRRGGTRFDAIAYPSGETTRSVRVSDRNCSRFNFCPGNVAATSANRRYVVLADGDAYVVDTRLHLPVARLEGAGYGVAAGAEPGVFYFVAADGTVRKTEILE